LNKGTIQKQRQQTTVQNVQKTNFEAVKRTSRICKIPRIGKKRQTKIFHSLFVRLLGVR